ncbi:MAG: NAD(+) diphosphatase [Caulobacteraceae bacterium]
MSRLSSSFNTYAGNPLDRQSVMRGDVEWVAERLSRADTRLHPLWKGQPFVTTKDGGVSLASIPLEVAKNTANADEDFLFLGLDRGAAVFAADLGGGADPADGPLHGFGKFQDLRSVTPLLSAEEAAIAATARGVFEWSRRHRFCSACGQPSNVVEAGWRRRCPACATEHFPRTDPVVIMLPVFGDRCLVGRQASWPEGRYSALAGFLEPGETIEEACAREVLEECGLEVTDVAYHSSQPWPYPSSLMIGLTAQVSGDDAAPDQTELEAVCWLTRAEARAVIAGDHPDILAPWPHAIAWRLINSWAHG